MSYHLPRRQMRYPDPMSKSGCDLASVVQKRHTISTILFPSKTLQGLPFPWLVASLSMAECKSTRCALIYRRMPSATIAKRNVPKARTIYIPLATLWAFSANSFPSAFHLRTPPIWLTRASCSRSRPQSRRMRAMLGGIMTAAPTSPSSDVLSNIYKVDSTSERIDQKVDRTTHGDVGKLAKSNTSCEASNTCEHMSVQFRSRMSVLTSAHNDHG
jgi:hypothetical protein